MFLLPKLKFFPSRILNIYLVSLFLLFIFCLIYVIFTKIFIKNQPPILFGEKVNELNSNITKINKNSSKYFSNELFIKIKPRFKSQVVEENPAKSGIKTIDKLYKYRTVKDIKKIADNKVSAVSSNSNNLNISLNIFVS